MAAAHSAVAQEGGEAVTYKKPASRPMLQDNGIAIPDGWGSVVPSSRETVTTSVQMDACNALCALGWKPYMTRVIDGDVMELISYPFPQDDGVHIGVMVRRVVEDPTSMFEYTVPQEDIQNAFLLLQEDGK